MRRDLLDYDLPAGLIADRPADERDGARLLRMGPDGSVSHHAVRDLAALLPAGALVVVNDTKVVPARLLGHKASGGRVEVFLLEFVGPATIDGQAAQRWLALGRASKPLRAGQRLSFGDPGRLAARVERNAGDGTIEVALFATDGGAIDDAIDAVGHVPLPPYVHRADDEADRARYQTTFARVRGAVAAPTAGLHLSERLLAAIEGRGVALAAVTLHVGLGTFQPVKVDDLDDHPMHAERFTVPTETARAVADARARGAPVIAIGTTVVRALESAADPDARGLVRATSGETRILIQPGYGFKVVDRLMTNFHLPQSTLLALVCAFAGTEPVLAAYRAAVAGAYRFYSYGDAMLLDRAIS